MNHSVLQELCIVAIVRGVAAEAAVPLAEALYEGGVRIMEVTMNTVGAVGMIRAIRDHLGDLMHVGAGTVTDVSEASDALAAGATFFVSPSFDAAVIEYAVKSGIFMMAGAFTPTEIVAAHKAGAHAVKVFPCSSVGPQYIRDLRGPLPHIPLIAVGGVDMSTAAAFLRAGAVGLGVGSLLIDRAVVARGDYADVTMRARALVACVREAKQGEGD